MDGKGFQNRSQRWGGNQYTGGKYKYAAKVSKTLKYAGYVGTATSMLFTEQDYRNGMINSPQRAIDHVVNVVSLIPVGGTLVPVFFELGKNYGPSSW